MTSNRKNVAVFSAAFAAFSLPAWLYLQRHGWSEESLGVTLRIGARTALLIYLSIFVARPLRDLLVNSFSDSLLKNRRYLGIAFAAVMSAHLYLLIRLNGFQIAIPGMIAFTLIYLMLITSFNKPAAAMGPKRWRVLHKTGIYVVGLLFLVTVADGVVNVYHSIEPPSDGWIYYVLAGLIVVALLIRITAWLKKQRTPAIAQAGDQAR